MTDPKARDLVSSCWVVADGSAGAESQSIGLAEALGLDFELKRVSHPSVLHLLPPQLIPPSLWMATARRTPVDGVAWRDNRLEPPWPDLLISCSRKAVGYAIAIRRLARGATFAIHVQHPLVPAGCFDLVVPPAHDGLTGANVIPTRGALNRVTPARLAAAADAIGPSLRHLPRPLIAVLIGGTTRRHRLEVADARRIAQRLQRFADTHGAGLAVTPSRRTPAGVLGVLLDEFKGLACHCWDGTGENPYFGYLALADAIAVSGDSVSMLSEACTTGKPVFMIELEGGSARFNRFYDTLRQAGMIRPLGEHIESWHYAPLDDTPRVAEAVRERLATRQHLRN